MPHPERWAALPRVGRKDWKNSSELCQRASEDTKPANHFTESDKEPVHELLGIPSPGPQAPPVL